MEPNIRIARRDFDNICRMAVRGVGVAIALESAAHRAKGSVHIKVLSFSDSWSKCKLSLCVAMNRSSSPVVDSLLRHFGVGSWAKLQMALCKYNVRNGSRLCENEFHPSELRQPSVGRTRWGWAASFRAPIVGSRRCFPSVSTTMWPRMDSVAKRHPNTV